MSEPDDPNDVDAPISTPLSSTAPATAVNPLAEELASAESHAALTPTGPPTPVFPSAPTPQIPRAPLPPTLVPPTPAPAPAPAPEPEPEPEPAPAPEPEPAPAPVPEPVPEPAPAPAPAPVPEPVPEPAPAPAPAPAPPAEPIAAAPTVDEPFAAAPTVDEPAAAAAAAAAEQAAGGVAAPRVPLFRRRPLQIAAACALVLMAALAVTFGVRHLIVLRVARDRARALGVEITSASVAGFGLRELELADVEFTLADVPGLRGRADRVRATERDGAQHVAAWGLAVAIAGDPAASFDALSAWSRAHPAAFAADLRAALASLEVRGADATAPWFTAKRGRLAADASGLRLDAEASSLLGFSSGALSATWAKDGSRATVALGRGASGDHAAPLHFELKPKGDVAEVEATLARTPLSDLAPRMKADARAAAKAHATATLRRGGALDGVVNATIEGWVPPHEKEADGVIYGAETRVAAAFRVPADGAALLVDDATVEVGGLKLKGGGSIDRHGGPRVKLDLKGSLPCSQVARSAAGSYGPLGAIVGDLASGHVAGSVAIAIHVEGDVRDPKTFRPKPSVKQGCQVR